MNFFKKPSSDKIAADNVEEAKRKLIEEQSAAEYHQKMAEYYQGVIARLSKAQ